ncbi:MAG TPA: DUF3293 domain-containing protein [Ferrovibrio sp.]|jgi:hypothetical protein|uniref:DUF3293 domain-containing protein n=1 Tax=Ferrovibrio sp. TaxID=1917215 RepID=UPI002ED1A7C0
MISEATLRGFGDTSYTIGTPAGESIGLRLGEPNAEADRLLTRLGARSLCCLNAWNPGSRPQPAARNMAFHQRLRRDLLRRGCRILPHLGVPDRPGWRSEPGFAILDLAKEKAVRLAEAYGQYGLVFYERGGTAELLLTRRALR